MSNKIIEENMSFSSGGDPQPNSTVRPALTTVKYPSIAPLLYIPNSNNQSNPNAVKVFPSTQIPVSQRAPVRVSTISNSSSSTSPLLHTGNRSLLNKPPNPLIASSKNNQTIVVANSSGVIRSMPAAMVMGGGTHKKQIITFGNSISNVGNQVSLLDPKNLKYIGTFIKNKKSVEASTETTNQQEDQNVLLVSTSTTVPVNQSPTYILPKTQKSVSQNLVYTQVPASQGKRLQVLLTTEGALQTKSSVSLVQSGNFSATPTASKQESIITNRVQSSASSSNTTKSGESQKDTESSTEQPCFSKSDIQEHLAPKSKPGKYVLPRTGNNYKSAQNPVLVPVKWKKQEETSGRLQATSLGQIVSSNPTGSVTSFQISNGQILTEKVTKPRMLSLLYENYGAEAKQGSATEKSSDTKTEGDKKPAEEIQGGSVLESTNSENTNKPAEQVKADAGTVRHRRKQELEVKQDAVHVSGDENLQQTKEEDMQKTDQKSGANHFLIASARKDLDYDTNKEVEEITRASEESKTLLKENVQLDDKESTNEISDSEKENKNTKDVFESENFDPIKCLEWSDNIGSLPLSDLKFRLNEFGLIEVVEDDEDEGKISSKSSVVSDPEKSDSRYKKSKTSRTSDEILCCHSCGTYGMGCEFVSSRFCSVACSKAYAEEKAQSVKKNLLKQEKKMKLKQQKSLLLQQKAKLEKLGLHEAKMTIEEKIRMLRMERELMKTNGGDSDGESGSGTSSNNDKLRSSSKGSFSWTRYLTMLKAKSAPYTLFKDPFPSTKNNFKVGMKLEGIDPIHPSLFCVLTVSAVRGYRIKLHFDGYPDCHDFWVNANSSDIFHAGWCERTNHKLSAPKGYAERNFNWGNYLRMTRTVAAPKSCFVNNQERPIIPSGFRVGMKLEAVDKKNSSLVCVATIADVLDNRILVHFDSWDDIYDYWVDCTSPYIHPVGWCKENGHQLTPPNDKDPSLFSWDSYLRESRSLPAPARAFKPRTTTDFRRGMKLECVDKRNPMLIRVATVVDIVVQQIKIKFDGWPDQYAYWLDDDSPDIHPAGWCHKTGHPLEPPPSEEDIKNTSICPTPGCRGIGHVKGKHPVHRMILSCPYSSLNYLRDDHIPDRFCSKREYYEVKETSLSKGTKPRPGVPRKTKTEVVTSPISKPDNRGRKRKTETPILAKKKTRTGSVIEEDVDANLRNEPPLWTKNRWDISETVASIGSNPLCWTPSQVALFVENINNSSEKGKLFTEHQIDGEALLMLSQNDLVQILGFKLGPAIKLYKSIVLLRQKALEIKNGVSS